MKSVKSSYRKRHLKIGEDLIGEGQAPGEYEVKEVLVPSDKAISLLEGEECLPMMMITTAAMKMDPADLAVATEVEGHLVGRRVDRLGVDRQEVDPVDQLHLGLLGHLGLQDMDRIKDTLKGAILTRLYWNGLPYSRKSPLRPLWLR
jgi:hypothetical protein